MRSIKIMMTSLCLAAPLMMGVTANAAPIDKNEVCLETSIAKNAEKIQLELMGGDTTPYAFIGLSIADDYVNIRKTADTDGEILGKLYKGGAVLLEEMHGEWAKIVSGSVEGYVSSKYLAIGEEIKDMLDEYALTFAKSNTETLRVRADHSEKASVLGLISEGQPYRVLAEEDEWVKIDFDGTKGYVAKAYVSIYHEFENAVSIEEERKNQEAEELARQQEAEELAKQQAANAAKTQSTTSSKKTTTSSSTSSSKTSSNKSSTTNKTTSSQTASSNSGSTTGSALVAYAKQFVGNPYVWGGTSLTNGTDCSGFTQAVYRKFGYSIPRTSRQQAKVGRSVSASNLQAGDLVFYASGGTVNHVAIYIGGGKIVHASNPKDGIKISKYNYRTPYAIKRIIK